MLFTRSGLSGSAISPVLIGLLAALFFACKTAFAFGFDDVAKRARTLASSGYKKPADIAKELASLTQDQYREIRHRPNQYHWNSEHLPFTLAFFPTGWQFQQPVRLNEITAAGVREIRFDPGLFDYGRSRVDAAAAKAGGFAGFRVLYPVNAPSRRDEVLSFLGASYWRALGKGQHYGLSARGLALDTALPSGEEFPRFVEFWIQRPAATARELTIYGLLDSPRAAAAYRFVLKPGIQTAMDVKSRLYLRDKIEKVGLAPLTSMFYFGENQRGPIEDFRPEVHDSDGLSVKFANGDWIWRPLVNPKRLLVTSFAATDPAGFGLMQRDRNFSRYEDLAARPDLRPSAWVEPKGAWGAGRVELVQIPASDETNDNIVAYWVPDKAPAPKQPFDLEYRLLWQKDAASHPLNAWVTQTRRGRSFSRSPDGSIGLLIDFEGPALLNLSASAPPKPDFNADSNAKILQLSALPNDATGGWRTLLRLRRIDEAKPVELRGLLRGPAGILSETWSYILPPG